MYEKVYETAKNGGFRRHPETGLCMKRVGKVDVTKTKGYEGVSYNSYKFIHKSYARAVL